MIEDGNESAAFTDVVCDECWGCSIIHCRPMLCAEHRSDVERVHLTAGQKLSRRAAAARITASRKMRGDRGKFV